MINLFAIILCGFLLGSIPAGRIVAKLWGGVDITSCGSGNPGATNVYRVLGWKPALPVALVDVAKGYVAAVFLIQMQWMPLPVTEPVVRIIAGFSAVAGHVWSLFSHFRGGKGVLTALGMICGLMPLAAAICLGVWVIVFSISRYVSLGSLVAALVLPVVVGVQTFGMAGDIPIEFFALSCVISVLVIITHRSNIRRLIAGSENRFGKS